MTKQGSLAHFEVPPNALKKLYDEAVEQMQGFCEGIELS